jgi:hypothetical protein
MPGDPRSEAAGKLRGHRGAGRCDAVARNPKKIRSANSPKFVTGELPKRLGNLATGTLYIEPGGRWENGNSESFNWNLRNECMNRDLLLAEGGSDRDREVAVGIQDEALTLGAWSHQT